jgi:hypothetical protein
MKHTEWKQKMEKPTLKTSMKTKGIKIVAALEKAATAVVLATYKAISSCTSPVIDRATTATRNNYLN